MHKTKKSLTKNIGIDGSGINCQKPLFSFYNLQKQENFFPKNLDKLIKRIEDPLNKLRNFIN